MTPRRIHIGRCTPAVAAKANEITRDSQAELAIALSYVVEPRARRRLIDVHASILAARLTALLKGEKRAVAS